MDASVVPEKTKRKFSNRSKTGCGKCKARKKKCDEAKPQCNNCRRLDLVCVGYEDEDPLQTRTAPTSGWTTTAGGRKPHSKNNLSSLNYILNREAGGGGSQQSNPHSHLRPRPLTDGARVGGRTIAVNRQGYQMSALRSLPVDWTEPPQALDPSVHPPTLPPLWRPYALMNEKETKAQSHGGDHIAPGSTMMLTATHHQMPQQLQPPSSRTASMPNIRHLGNIRTSQEELSKPCIVIGDNVILGPYCQLHGAGKITIGRNSNIGAYVTITTDSDSVQVGPNVKADTHVCIGDDVHIGKGCIIGPGVQIGRRTAVPSGSFVVCNVPMDS